MRRLGHFLACLLLALLPQAARAAPPERLDAAALAGHGLPLLTVDGIQVYHSAGAREQAERFGRAIAAALAWYRAELGWQGDLAVAVLDAGDWPALVWLPYPVPHAVRPTGLLVMPDSIASFPGFPAWDFDADGLNEALIFHEAGHLIAGELGLLPGNLWVDELVANLFLAAYVRAERPDLARILAGVPPRFANPGPFDQLFDLDSFYAAGGLENYAWFQFRLAALADAMLEGRDFAMVMQGMQAAFPADRRLTVARSLALVDAVSPGATALVADMAGDGVLPALAPKDCGASQPVEGAAGPVGWLFFDNRGSAPLGYRTPGDGRFTAVPAGEVTALQGAAGTLVELESGGCLTQPAGAARYSVGAGD